jgi:FK506-binding nuclear protein
MFLFDAGTTAFWACSVAPGKPHECSVPAGVELQLKGACVAADAKKKKKKGGGTTLTVSPEDGSTTSVLARLSLAGGRDCCKLNHIVSSGECVLSVTGTSAVHVTGNLVQTEPSAEDLTEDNTEGWSFVSPDEEPQRARAEEELEAESESESDGLEEVVIDTARMDADGGGDSDKDSLDDDTGTVDYSDDDTDDEGAGDRRLDDDELAAASPSKAEREELALDAVAQPEATEDDGDGDESEDESESEDEDGVGEHPLDLLNRANSAQLKSQKRALAEAEANKPPKKAKRPKKEKPTPVFDTTPGPEPSKSQKTKANKLLKQMKTKPSGLLVYDQQAGRGERPKKGRKIRCHYTLRLGGPTGKLVQHSGGKPYELRLGLGEVIKGWDEGLAGMKHGGKRAVLVPPALGYGKTGSPPMIPPHSTLFFELELLP